MAHRGTHPIEGARTYTHLLTSRLVGAGAADMSVDDADEAGGGEIVSATQTATGTFDLVFRHSYPKLLYVFPVGHVGDTEGLQGRFTAWDPVAKTATIVFEVADGAAASTAATFVATDPAATDTIYLAWMVRNSGAN